MASFLYEIFTKSKILLRYELMGRLVVVKRMSCLFFIDRNPLFLPENEVNGEFSSLFMSKIEGCGEFTQSTLKFCENV